MKIDELSPTTTNSNRLSYNGKELDKDLNWYHYGARFYDPAIGRWWVTDPMDEFHTPYLYVGQNPINFVDPDGMYSNSIYDWFGNYLGTDHLGENGGAIFMDASDFTQGMHHDMALKVGKMLGETVTVTADAMSDLEVWYWWQGITSPIQRNYYSRFPSLTSRVYRVSAKAIEWSFEIGLSFVPVTKLWKGVKYGYKYGKTGYQAVKRFTQPLVSKGNKLVRSGLRKYVKGMKRPGRSAIEDYFNSAEKLHRNIKDFGHGLAPSGYPNPSWGGFGAGLYNFYTEDPWSIGF